MWSELSSFYLHFKSHSKTALTSRDSTDILSHLRSKSVAWFPQRIVISYLIEITSHLLSNFWEKCDILKNNPFNFELKLHSISFVFKQTCRISHVSKNNLQKFKATRNNSLNWECLSVVCWKYNLSVDGSRGFQ